jgi:hypothetical protein
LNAYKVLAAAGLLLLLAGSSPAFASSPHGSLSLTMNGIILSSGAEDYYHTGGQVLAGSVLGQALDPSRSTTHFSVSATVSGVDVSGAATFTISQNGPGGTHTQVDGVAVIGGMVPAEQFPLGCVMGTNCTSAIPGVFLGAASVTITVCHGSSSAGACSVNEELALPMEFESAFLDPHGGPILMSSLGGEVTLVSTYSQARVQWSGTELGGVVSGSLSGSPVAGYFSMNVSATEDLAAGYELDKGSIAFFGMSNPALDAYGTFTGRSTIPLGTPCPAELGFPPGTCQVTGFSSSGVFSQSTALGGSVTGSYATTWIAPAVAFTSVVSAVLK